MKDASTTPLQPDACIPDYNCLDTYVNSNVASETPKRSNSLSSNCYASNIAASKTPQPTYGFTQQRSFWMQQCYVATCSIRSILPQSSVAPLMVLHSSDCFGRNNATLLHVASVTYCHSPVQRLSWFYIVAIVLDVAMLCCYMQHRQRSAWCSLGISKGGSSLVAAGFHFEH